MTVAEAIELLKTFPPDVPVIGNWCSDFIELDAGNFELIDGKRNFESGGLGLACHKGHLMEVHKRWIDPNEPPPQFITAVHIG